MSNKILSDFKKRLNNIDRGSQEEDEFYMEFMDILIDSINSEKKTKCALFKNTNINSEIPDKLLKEYKKRLKKKNIGIVKISQIKKTTTYYCPTCSDELRNKKKSEVYCDNCEVSFDIKNTNLGIVKYFNSSKSNEKIPKKIIKKHCSLCYGHLLKTEVKGTLCCDECGSIAYLNKKTKTNYIEPEITLYEPEKIINDCDNCKIGQYIIDRNNKTCWNCGFCVKSIFFSDRFDSSSSIVQKIRIYKSRDYYKRFINSKKNLPKPVKTTLLREFDKIHFKLSEIYKGTRKNSLNYSYITRRLLQLTNNHEYLRQFKKIKSNKNLQTYNNIWSQLCDEMNYKYIPDT